MISRIKNILRWIPILWNDHDWDGDYTIRLLKYKISHVRKYHEKHRRFEGWENEVKWMKVVERLAEAKISGHYWKVDELYFNSKNMPNNYRSYYEIVGKDVGRDYMEDKCEKLFWKILMWKNKFWWD